MVKILYFAYGSNLLQSRLEKRVGKVKKVCVSEIQDFKLSFNYGNNEQSFLNIKPCKNAKVLGVVYELTLFQLFILDFYEGYNVKGCYTRIIELIDNKPVFVYISYNTRKEFFKGVSKDYLDTVNKGRIENNLKLLVWTMY